MKKLSKIASIEIPWHILGLSLPFGAVLFLCIGFLGKFYWIFDLFSNFRPQYVLLALLGGVSLSFKKKYRKLAIYSYITAFICFFFIVYIYFPVSQKIDSKDSIKIRLMQINVLTSNMEYQKVITSIFKNNPDIILLDEVDFQWLGKLQTIRDKYPYSIERPRGDNFGIMMLSKKQANFWEIRMSKHAIVPYIYAKFNLQNNKQLCIYGVHLLPPIGKSNFNLRNSQLAELSGEINKYNCKNTIVLGDLNLTPWSYFFSEFEKDSGLINSQLGFGIQASWPYKLLLFRIPIDHCLVSPSIKVTKRQLGKSTGSDHLPLIVDLEI